MLIYLLIINIIAFIMYGIDKWKAHRKQWRISEKMLKKNHTDPEREADLKDIA